MVHQHSLNCEEGQQLWCLKAFGANQDNLLDVYFKQVWSILEYVAPVWHSSIAWDERMNKQIIQKSALNIIFGQEYHSYRTAMKTIRLDSSFERRRKMSKTKVQNCLQPDFEIQKESPKLPYWLIQSRIIVYLQ